MASTEEEAMMSTVYDLELEHILLPRDKVVVTLKCKEALFTRRLFIAF